MAQYQRAPNGDYELLEESSEFEVDAIPTPSSEEPWAYRHAAVLLPSLLVGAYFLGRWWQARKKTSAPTSWTP